MNTPIQKRQIWLRPAAGEDAEAIYGLKRQAFGATCLPFTIYRSPKTIAYIARSICTTEQAFIVAEAHEELAGYANVAFLSDHPMLNYIAVSDAARGFGIGSRLLHAAESRVCEQGFRTLALDVFESNTKAVKWYAASGYRLISQSFLYRIDLVGVTCKQSELQIHSSLWQAALATEKQNGFSKVIGTRDEAEITLGLIGGVAGKLLDHQRIQLDEAIDLAIGKIAESRSELIVHSKSAPGSRYPMLSLETSLRMAKAL